MRIIRHIIAFAFLTQALSMQSLADESQINLPNMGDSTGSLISPNEEKELGQAFFRSVQAQLEINHDADIHEYIQSVGQQLVVNSDEPGSHFYFFVVIDDAINAFAGPGGYIGVNSGLILTSQSESELASVMAHEIAHVTQRHIYRAFEAASRLSIPTAAATIAAILLGTQSAELGTAALMAIQAGSAQSQINFTRSNEEEADRVGIQTLARSGYNPRSMPVFFERLQQSSRYYGRGIPEFLRTHPVTSSRISDTRNRAEKYPYQQYPDSMDYLLCKAKLRVATSEHDNDVEHMFQSAQKRGTEQQKSVARYGLALLDMKKQNFDSARTTLTELTKQSPRQNQFLSALAEIEIETRNYHQAITLYKKIIKDHPYNNSAKLQYISTLLKIGEAQQARIYLQSLPSEQQKQPAYFLLLARAYNKLNKIAESHRYMAEYYYAIGDTQLAIIQTRLAQKAPDSNFYLSAILDERLQFYIQEEHQKQMNK